MPNTPPVRPVESPPGIALGDVYYALFRHKGKIIFFSFLGLVAAAGIYFLREPLYESSAKLLVRYVREAKSIEAGGPNAQVQSPDQRGETIINSELEILTSVDLAAQVADAVGPEKIVANTSGGTNRNSAASLILRNLSVEAPKLSSIIRVSFRHSDPQMAQEVLRQLTAGYLKKHAEVHRASGVYDEFLTRQTDDLRSRLNQTEEDLRKLKLKAGVGSLEDSKKLAAEQVARIQENLISAEAELAQRRTMLEKLQGEASTTAAQAATNAADTNAAPALVETPMDPEKEKHYRTICAHLESLRQRELDLLLQFTGENVLVKQVRERIAETEKTKEALEAAEPRLMRSLKTLLPSANPLYADRTATFDPTNELLLVAALEAKVKILNDYLKKAQDDIAAVNDAEAGITDLERKKALQEANYRYFSASLEQARIDEALASGKISNISIVQEASVPRLARKETLKAVAMALGGGVFGGIGLALLLEFYLSGTVKRPVDVEQKLRLPLFLSIPDFSRNGYRRVKRPQPARLPVPKPKTKTPVAPAPPLDPLVPYTEALRDRLIMYFQAREMTHKPKLVGITTLGRGTSASEIAAGLARTLSETGEGRVLLVDMHHASGPAVHPFFQGQTLHELDDAFEEEKRTPGLVQSNLWVAVPGTAGQGKVGIIPRRFLSLLPKMKASDYDYIIFDMPPVNQTSVTSKIAGLLDMTFLVVESEQTGIERAKRAVALLHESRATVGAVLDRYHDYVPRWLSADL